MESFKNQSGFVKFIVIIIVIVAVFAAIHFIKKPTSPGSKNTSQQSSTKSTSKKQKPASSASLKDLPLNEKMNRAEDFLTQFERDMNDFLKKTENKEFSPQELQKHMKEYNSIMQGYTNKINGLQLMCPVSAKVKTSSQYTRYRNWCEQFQKKDMKVMAEVNQRVQKFLEKAGFSRR